MKTAKDLSFLPQVLNPQSAVEEVNQLITQTQQETLEWCEKEIADKIGQWEFDWNMEKVTESFSDWVEKKIRQTIKQRKEDKQ